MAFLNNAGLERLWGKITTKLNTKVDKVSGKGLSTNDYTTTEKNKLAGIATGATKVTVDSALSSSSTNPVQNKVINTAISNLNTLVGDTSVASQISSATNNCITGLSVSGKTVTYTKKDGSTGTITTQDTNTTYSNATTSAAGLMSKDDKAKLDAITASADAVSFSRSLTSGTKVGTITINGTGTDLYAPTNTDTHYTTGLKVGASNTATANAAASNGSVYLNVLDNTTVRDSHKITGSGATTVTSDANGVITISSTNTTYSTATSSANGLMSSSDKAKLDGIASGATKVTVDSALSSSSTNPVQNKIVNTEINGLKTLVGDTAVSTQITNAISSNRMVYAQNDEPTNAITGSLWVDLSEQGEGNVTAEQVGALPSTGGTLTGELKMNNNLISGLKTPTENAHAANKQYVDTAKAAANTYTNTSVRKAAPRNLLDNSDFTNLVAQAGIGGNHGSIAYAADRWILTSGTVSYTAGTGLTLNGTITQKLENAPATAYPYVGMASGTASISYASSAVIITSSGGVLKWAALYEGSYTAETLPEYQPRGYAAELLECQRYYYRINGISDTHYVFSSGFRFGDEILSIIHTPTSMRIKNVAMSYNAISGLVGYVSGFPTLTKAYASGTTISIWSTVGFGNNGSPALLRFEPITDAYIAFIADL